MNNATSIFHNVLMATSLYGLGLCIFAMYAVLVVKTFHRFENSGAKRLHFIFAALLFVGAAVIKPSTQFSFAVGLKDDGSYATNNFVHIEWVKSGVPYVPNTSTVYIDYRHKESTNEWIELADIPVTRYYFDATLENATNLVFNIWWYNEEHEVRTNGVWIYKTSRAKSQSQSTDTCDIIPLRATTVLNGKAIAPPSKKE